jgi:hypothetical protein
MDLCLLPVLLRPGGVCPCILQPEAGDSCGAHRQGFSSGLLSPVNLPLRIDRCKVVLEGPDRLRGTEEQDAPFVQGVMEELKDPPLYLRVEVDEHVAADDEIHLRERRILEQVLDGKDDLLPQFPPNPGGAPFLEEELLQPVPGDIGRDPLAVSPLPGRFDGMTVEVGGVDLHGGPEVQPLHGLRKDHGNGIRLFAAGAARHPDPEGVLFPMRPDQLGKDLCAQRREGLRVAEEARDVDQHFMKQLVDFLGVFFKVLGILVGLRDLQHLHPAPDPAIDRVHLVDGKIRSGALPEPQQNPLKGLPRNDRGPFCPGRMDAPGVPDEMFGHLRRRQDEIGQTGCRCAGGHPGVTRRGRILHHDHAEGILDGADPQGPVTPGPRKHDPHRMLPLVEGQRTEKRIDGELAG